MKDLFEVLDENELGFDRVRRIKEEHSMNSHSSKYERCYFDEKRQLIVHNCLGGGSAPQHLIKREIPVKKISDGGESRISPFDKWWFDTEPMK